MNTPALPPMVDAALDAALAAMFDAPAETSGATAADVELTPEQLADALAAKATDAEKALIDAMIEEAYLAESVKLEREEALKPIADIIARYDEAKKASAAARQRLLEVGAEFVQGESKGAPLDAFTYLQFKGTKTTVITASDDEVMAWLRQNMPALIVPQTFDPESVMRAAQGLPAAVRPEWVKTTEEKQPQVKTKALNEKAAAVRAEQDAALDAEVDAFMQLADQIAATEEVTDATP